MQVEQWEAEGECFTIVICQRGVRYRIAMINIVLTRMRHESIS